MGTNPYTDKEMLHCGDVCRMNIGIMSFLAACLEQVKHHINMHKLTFDLGATAVDHLVEDVK